MFNFPEIMVWPFFACLILAGIHTYLGLHIIEREVIFVDLALAQIAALGASLGAVFGYGVDSPESYWLSLGFTIAGAGIFSLSRLEKQKIPQEAIIGIVYAVSAALLVMVLSRSGDGDEHFREAFVGNILLIQPKEVYGILFIYLIVGIFHYFFRRKFFVISQDPENARKQGLNVRWWDFIFYASLGFIVTSSVKIAGVLLVFSFLIVPAAAAILFSKHPAKRLFIGWLIGFLASIAGMAVSYYWDFPTGASVVCVLGFFLILSVFICGFLTKNKSMG